VCAGQPIEEAVAVASSAPNVVAVGINCTDPVFVAELVGRIRATSDLPVVIYPNAGGAWDPSDGSWLEAGHHSFADELVRAWRAAGATAIGGCCGTDAGAISSIRRLLAE
jgi:homocysteine S-methyltransferase